MSFQESIWRKVSNWLGEERPVGDAYLCDFDRLSYEIRPGDVLLVEGQSRVSNVIKTITQSVWTHAAIYIGRLHDIDSPALREQVSRFHRGDERGQLLIEAILGRGTIVTPLEYYRDFHLRICRPRDISRSDAQQVLAFAIQHLGANYDVRQLLDLARFMLPYAFLPRRWRSSLFEYQAGDATRCICSTMLVEAFQTIQFPVLPIVREDANGERRIFRRNPRLFVPRDFDYSPYFDIIKYPYYADRHHPAYRNMPWSHEDLMCNDEGDCFVPGGRGDDALAADVDTKG